MNLYNFISFWRRKLTLPVSFLVLLLYLLKSSLTASIERPSILWITAEDMSPVLGCYDHIDAITPNIDKLALESIKFKNAFASAPVCSPSRSCLIQGALPPSMGTQHMRSGFSLPASFIGFPAFKERGILHHE